MSFSVAPPAPYDSLTADLLVLGADDSDHVNGSLLSHLKGTHALLSDWGNRDALCVAGLYHAVYATHGFHQALVDVDDRDALRAQIGTDAENIVYHFCACDRDDFYPRIGREPMPAFRDRFTETTFALPEPLLRDLLELTMANEAEIAIREQGGAPALPSLKSQLKNVLRPLVRGLLPRPTNAQEMFTELFARCQPYVSEAAFASYRQVFLGKS